jgi:hypothetical protein
LTRIQIVGRYDPDCFEAFRQYNGDHSVPFGLAIIHEPNLAICVLLVDQDRIARERLFNLDAFDSMRPDLP